MRDNAAIVRKLGFDIVALAAAQAAADQANGPAVWRLEAMAAVRSGAVKVEAGALPNPTQDPQAYARWYFASVLQSRAPEATAAAYAPSARVNLPDECRPVGHDAIAAGRAAIFDCFEGGAITLDHIASVIEGPYTDTALRWSYTARHAHDGLYGAATGRDIYILAVTNLRTIDGQIAEEWTIFDELALRRQMAGGL